MGPTARVFEAVGIEGRAATLMDLFKCGMRIRAADGSMPGRRCCGSPSARWSYWLCEPLPRREHEILNHRIWSPCGKGLRGPK